MNATIVSATRIADGVDPVPAWAELKALVVFAKSQFEFGLARQILERARRQAWDDPRQAVWITQQLAFSTYKDDELVPSVRFARALALLDEIGLRDPDAVDPARIPPSTLPETLGLGGAVYKRKWEEEGQLEHLHQSYTFYVSAWERDSRQDMGYGGVNAACVLDILGWRARILALRSGVRPDVVDEREEVKRFQADARRLRLDMLEQIPHFAASKKQSGEDPGIEESYWYLVTMAEIHFGLERYDEAAECLAAAREALAQEPDFLKATWERQTTSRQLVTLARIRGIEPPQEGTESATWHRAWKALHAFLGDDTEPALTCYRGGVGLALSGGGFRASLFHIGVLARLAETDVLRSVEILSTVSGGSIVGAHYYLEVRNLLRSKRDRDISREDYILIVRRLQEHFLAGVQRNLRTRTLSNLFDNFRMIVFESYTRSHRLGELYEQELYSRVADGHAPEEPRRMADLAIQPADADTEPFKPKFSNWKRRAKVPVLILNSTSLNSGHSWHFTARWMGEPPGLLGPEVNVNAQYRRLWYQQAPTAALQNFRLGHAVAASACVPGLFDPVVLEGLYPGRTVRLVDGGVHDNQGVAALLNEGCTLMLCSDASGQMEDQTRPADSLVGVPLRSNSILMSRVREVEYQDLKSRLDSRALRGLLFVHLKKGLEVMPLDWINCQDPTVLPDASPTATPYGVDKDLQRKLAAVRTDLDSFSEVEAYALMLSGYLMTEHELKELDRIHQADREPGTWGGFAVDAPRRQWTFLELESLMRQAPGSSDARREELGKQVAVASSLFFKIWQLSTALKNVVYAAGAGALIGLGWILARYWNTEVMLPWSAISFKSLVIWVALAVAAILVPVSKWLRPEQAMRSYVAKTMLACMGFLFSNLHLRTFDRMFLRRGRLKRLRTLP